MYLCLLLWIVFSMCVIFYTCAEVYGDGEWGGVNSDTFSLGIVISLFFFFISYGVHYMQLSDKIQSNHNSYSECVRLNAVGASVGVKLENMPEAKLLCAELYQKSI